MPPTYNATAGTAQFTGASTTTFALTMPGTPNDGDVLVCGMSHQSNSSAVTASFNVGPWLLAGSATSALSTTGTVTQVFYRRWRTGDPTSWTVTLSANRVVAAFCRAYGGVHPQMLTDHGVLVASGTAVTSLQVIARLISAEALLLGVCGTSNTAAVTPPATATEIHELVSTTYRCELTEESPGVAAGGLLRQYGFGASANAALVVFALRPDTTPSQAWYVRPDGNDGNAGNGPAPSEAFATLARALGTGTPFQYGERVRIAPGTYRETVTLGMLDQFAGGLLYATVDGDVQATHFPDLPGGAVVWSAYTAGDAAAPAAAPCVSALGRSRVEFYNIHFIGGNPASGATCISGGGTQSGWTLQQCHFQGGKQAAQAQVDLYAGPVTANTWHWIDACVFDISYGATGLQILATTAASGPDADSQIDVRNCLFLMGSVGLGMVISGAGATRTGGVLIRNNTFWHCGSGVVLASGGSFHVPSIAVNNFLYNCTTGFSVPSGGAGQMLEEYNCNISSTPRSNMLGGSGDVTGLGFAPRVATGQHLSVGNRMRPLASPLPGSPLLGWGRNEVAGRSPTAAANDASIGTVSWSSPTSAFVSDDVRATAVAIPASTGQTNYLVLTGFGLPVPSDATILGVRVEVEASAGASSSIRFNAVRLVKGGVIGGDDRSTDNVSNFSTSDGFFSFGGHNALWGQTWTAAEVTAAGFGVAVSLKNIHASTPADGRIDYVKLVVTYTPAYADLDYDLQWTDRPSGGQVLAACGAMECANTMAREATVFHSGDLAGRIDGPGYQDFEVPLPDSTVTVKLWMRKNAAYAGQQPEFRIVHDGEIDTWGDAVMTAGTDAWEQLSVTVTATRPGIGTLRVISYSTATAGAVYVDDVTVE